MSKIDDCYGAETQLREWMSQKYPKARLHNIDKVWKKGNDWFIEGEFEVQKGFIGTEQKVFKLRISLEGNITGYEVSEKKLKSVKMNHDK